MRIIKNKRNNTNKIIVIAITAVLILGGVAAWYFLVYKPGSDTTKNTQTINLEPPTEEQVNTGNDTKKDTIENSTKDNESGTPPVTDTIPITVSYSNKDGEAYRLRYLIDEELNNGTCTLTLIQSNKTVTKSAAVQASSSSSTCQGFDIAISELGSGTWKANLVIKSNSRTGSTSSTIDI